MSIHCSTMPMFDKMGRHNYKILVLIAYVQMLHFNLYALLDFPSGLMQ